MQSERVGQYVAWVASHRGANGPRQDNHIPHKGGRHTYYPMAERHRERGRWAWRGGWRSPGGQDERITDLAAPTPPSTRMGMGILAMCS